MVCFYKNVTISRYDSTFNDGMLFMATPGMGETFGYVANGFKIKNDHEFLDLLNLNNFPVKLALTIHYIDGISQTTEHYVAGYNQWTGILLTDDKIVTRSNISYAIEYKATSYYNNQYAPVIANFIHARTNHMEGIRFQQNSHRHWEFAEGFRASNKYDTRDYLYIFNPSNVEATGKITIYYDDGLEPTEIPFTISSHTKKSFALHNMDELRNSHSWGGIAYGIHIDSNLGVIPYFKHQDANFGGSFALRGTGWD
ncbi:hypothetical protein QUF74_18760 [Candidatus Halobeggiatoa sp. HSG11]|nr:hypothetical protein [Candidatus Halobeggiatoa sp. HSG11]